MAVRIISTWHSLHMKSNLQRVCSTGKCCILFPTWYSLTKKNKKTKTGAYQVYTVGTYTYEFLIIITRFVR